MRNLFYVVAVAVVIGTLGCASTTPGPDGHNPVRPLLRAAVKVADALLDQ